MEGAAAVISPTIVPSTPIANKTPSRLEARLSILSSLSPFSQHSIFGHRITARINIGNRKNMASNATFADILDEFFPTASESDGGEAIKMMIRPIMQRGMGLASEEAAHHQLRRTINEVSDWLFENGVAPHQICDQGFSMLIAKEIYGLCSMYAPLPAIFWLFSLTC